MIWILAFVVEILLFLALFWDKKKKKKENGKDEEEEEEIEKELENIPIPQLKTVNIDELFSPEEKEVFKEKRFVEERHREIEKPAEKKEKEL